MTGRDRRWRVPTWLVAAGLLAASCGASSAPPESTGSTVPAASTSTTTTTTGPTTTTSTSTTTTSTTTVPPTTTSTAPATTTSTLPAWWREVTTDDPLRVWLIGDSLAGPVGRALRARASEAGLIRADVDYEGGTGLVRPDVFDWPSFVAENLAGRAPEVVVVILGANDGQDLLPSQGSLGFGTAEWDARYRGLVGTFMDQLLGSARRVYWVGLPIMSGPNYDARMRHISGVLRWEASLRLDARFIEAYSLFQGEGGSFAFDLPDESGAPVPVRATDGIHYTAAGGDRMAERILEVLGADWRLATG